MESVDSHRQTELRICVHETNHNMGLRFLCSILHFVTWKSVHTFCWGKLRINTTYILFYDDIYFHFSLAVILIYFIAIVFYLFYSFWLVEFFYSVKYVNVNYSTVDCKYSLFLQDLFFRLKPKQ